MTKLLTLGANGCIARLVRKDLLVDKSDTHLTEYLHIADRLLVLDLPSETSIEGDANDYPRLLDAIKGQDIVFADLSGQLEPMADKTVRAMDQAGVRCLI